MSSTGNGTVSTHLNIIEPAQRCIKTFNTFEESDTRYFKHKHRVDSQTTHILNKMYSIPGYRITKIKGVLSLKRTHEKASGIKDPVMTAPLGLMSEVPNAKGSVFVSEQIQTSTERIGRLETSYDQIVDILNSRHL